MRPRTALVLFALTTSTLAGACGSTASDSGTAATSTTTAPTSTTAAPTSTSSTAAPTSTTAAPTGDVAFAERSHALLSFATAWDGADWAAMESFAPAEVVDVAKQWHEDGSEGATSLEFAVENECATEAIGICQIVYGGPQGPGLIFDVHFELTDSGTMVTQLVFGGDAG